MSQTDAEKKRKFRSAKRMREIMTEYYIEAKTADQTGKKVAWITSGGPVEPLIVMDVIPVYPENYGAMIGASHMGGDLCAKAEALGYSTDLCSYARADIACALENGGPIGGLPKPDMLICCNNICGTVMKWYEVQARLFNVPLFIFDTPFCHVDFADEARRYVRAQIDEYISFLEGVCKKKFDFDRSMEVGRLSLKGQQLWQEVLDAAAHRPSPMTAFDAFFFLALIVTLRGTDKVVNFYTELLEEMKERVSQGISAVENERYRLLWDNLPVWYRLKWLSDTFASHGACLVADTYTTAWCGSMKYIDENDFIDSMAEAYTRIYLNIGVDEMAKTIFEMIDKYEVDGLVMHSNRSCKPYSFGQYDLMRMVQEKKGIPCMMLESHMVDERSFSESQALTRIDAFMEVIRKRGPGAGTAR
ncbi:R-phenyllactate dehydratase subunit alpha [anaerobic digester metagenome]|jgi:bcr-type benzoyl-CoA reductase subunit B|uniref:R-phenyllactate dehydratase subunit alpha n=1 Tax=anaerobic digester metagenome TaxID=1263854 RepID=A0A485LYF9_9ZZZZ|nr:2-hydroxyacyl-CoA dehydratase [Deltaproteobacteria bacterium]HPD20420.1 2-hydroxyacyl-CoA dehydratase [Deltaproteobacteria bacterium]HRS55254.1 2-hydroxyacyl-CoA dehydratase [Desulfomonilia bacterium]HRV34818.1 2-hydroxyacyl-CoA dehydratase [Desulfomonilia bacterium]